MQTLLNPRIGKVCGDQLCDVLRAKLWLAITGPVTLASQDRTFTVCGGPPFFKVGLPFFSP
jgi:hypothetical protein